MCVMESLTKRVYAKINLSLDITGASNGKHELDSVMTSVDLSDVVSVRKTSRPGAAVTFDGASGTGTNAHRAAVLMCERFGLGGVEVSVTTGIRSGGGLGGSSADAAGVVRAIDELFGLYLDRGELMGLAAEVGSDVPFMLYGGYGRLRGTGAEVEFFDGPELNILLTCAGAVSTREAFAEFDRGGYDGRLCDCGELVKRLTLFDAAGAVRHISNALEGAAEVLLPRVGEAVRIMRGAGLYAAMTGSGGCVFGTGDGVAMERAERALLACGFTCERIKTVKSGCITV